MGEYLAERQRSFQASQQLRRHPAAIWTQARAFLTRSRSFIVPVLQMIPLSRAPASSARDGARAPVAAPQRDYRLRPAPPNGRGLRLGRLEGLELLVTLLELGLEETQAAGQFHDGPVAFV